VTAKDLGTLSSQAQDSMAFAAANLDTDTVANMSYNQAEFILQCSFNQQDCDNEKYQQNSVINLESFHKTFSGISTPLSTPNTAVATRSTILATYQKERRKLDLYMVNSLGEFPSLNIFNATIKFFVRICGSLLQVELF